MIKKYPAVIKLRGAVSLFYATTMVCHIPSLSHLVCGQSAELVYISTINEQTLATNSCQMKIMTLYITVFTQAAQCFQPLYLEHTLYPGP
jgi:hypothetical protein